MTIYQLPNDDVSRWKAWFTLNGIPTEQIVRGTPVTIDGDEVKVVEFDTVPGTPGRQARVLHDCTCAYGGKHLAKKQYRYHFTELPGEWADADRVEA